MAEVKSVKGATCIVDVTKADISYGGHIDWGLVPESYKSDDGKKFVPVNAFAGQSVATGNIYPVVAAKSAAVTIASNVATAELGAGHGYVVGDNIVLSGSSVAALNGTHSVKTVTATGITFDVTAANGSSNVQALPPIVGIFQHQMVEGKDMNHDNVALIVGGVLWQERVVAANGQLEGLKAALAQNSTGIVWERYSDSRLSAEAVVIN